MATGTQQAKVSPTNAIDPIRAAYHLRDVREVRVPRAAQQRPQKPSALAYASPALSAIAGAATGGAVVTPIAVGVASVVLSWLLHLRGARTERWWQKVCGKDQMKFDAEIAARVNDPKVQETILRSVRIILDVVDDAALPPLARLTRSYLDEARTPDPFFRSVARLLSETNSSDLALLTRIIKWAHAALHRPPTKNGPADNPQAVGCTLCIVNLERRSLEFVEELGDGRSTRLVFPNLPMPDDPVQLFELLQVSGVGRSDRFGDGTTLRATTVDALHGLLVVP